MEQSRRIVKRGLLHKAEKFKQKNRQKNLSRKIKRQKRIRQKLPEANAQKAENRKSQNKKAENKKAENKTAGRCCKSLTNNKMFLTANLIFHPYFYKTNGANVITIINLFIIIFT